VEEEADIAVLTPTADDLLLLSFLMSVKSTVLTDVCGMSISFLENISHAKVIGASNREM
jgi:hypothetical protein